tara:strand:- start:864 stop:1100 length:237 start_codon:yes stop_codon:yes gene_type:complete
MKEMLQTSQCRVIFTKLNGEERNMICTLREDIIPSATKDPITQKKVRDLNEEVLAVWDTKAEGWRSFRVANVLSFVCD